MASCLTAELLEGGSSRLPSEVTFSNSVLKNEGKDKPGRVIYFYEPHTAGSTF